MKTKQKCAVVTIIGKTEKFGI